MNKPAVTLRTDTKLGWYEKGMHDIVNSLAQFDTGLEQEDIGAVNIIIKMLVEKQQMQIEFAEQLSELEIQKK